MYDNTNCPISFIGIWSSLSFNYMRNLFEPTRYKMYWFDHWLDYDTVGYLYLLSLWPCGHCTCDHCQIYYHIGSISTHWANLKFCTKKLGLHHWSPRQSSVLDSDTGQHFLWCSRSTMTKNSWAHSPYCWPSESVRSSLGYHGQWRQCTFPAGLLAPSSFRQGEQTISHAPQFLGWWI